MYTDTIIVLSINVISGLIVLAIIYCLAIKQFKKQKEIELKAKAYVTFITKLLERGHDGSENSSRELHKAVGDVVLSGDYTVINEMINFYRDHGVLDSTQAKESFAKIISKMRKDIIGNDNKDTEIPLEGIILLLIGKER